MLHAYRVGRRLTHQKLCGGRLCIDVHNPRNGFFAHMEWVLELLAFRHMTGTPVEIRFTSPQYVTPTRGPDFMDYFFRRCDGVAPPVSKTRWFVIEEIDELGFHPSYDLALNVELAHRLFFDRYEFQPEFAAECEQIRDRLVGNRPTLGVHFRGTDKSRAAPRTAIDSVFHAVDDLLGRLPADASIFVATDESSFLDKCVARYGRRVSWLDDHLRSNDGQPVHLGRTVDGYQLGRDALMNCWILSRCDTAIKTASILSAWAKVLNPALPIFTLSRGSIAGRYFPERDIPDYRPTAAMGDRPADHVSDFLKM